MFMYLTWEFFLFPLLCEFTDVILQRITFSKRGLRNHTQGVFCKIYKIKKIKFSCLKAPSPSMVTLNLAARNSTLIDNSRIARNSSTIATKITSDKKKRTKHIKKRKKQTNKTKKKNKRRSDPSAAFDIHRNEWNWPISHRGKNGAIKLEIYSASSIVFFI